MKKRRGKKRSSSQRIGDLGESLFTTWALKHSLIPQKVDRDYGVDFFAQVANPISRGVDEITGAILAAHIRSVLGGDRPRVKLTRADVENALRVSVPFCFFAVDTSRERVHFLFLDEHIVRSLHQFLSSGRGATSIRLDEFHDQGFLKELTGISRSGYQERLRLLKAELGLAHAMPGSRLTVYQRSSGGVALLDLPWITQMLDVPSSCQEQVAAMVFEEGRLPNPGETDAAVREEVEALKALADGPLVIRGKFDMHIELCITAGSVTVKQPFQVRLVGDEFAFVNEESGLVLQMSGARRAGDQHVHQMGVRLVEKGAAPVDALKCKEFLRCLRPGAHVNEFGRSPIPVSAWPHLDHFGAMIDGLDLVRERLGIDTSQVRLADFKSQEFRLALSLLDLMLQGADIREIVPGFVLGPGAEAPVDPTKWMPVGFRIPLVANFKQHGIVVWVEGVGDRYVTDSVICGFRPRQRSKWECDIQSKRFKKGENPELWLVSDWPGVPLFAASTPGATSFSGTFDHPLSGDVWPLLDESPD